MSLVSRRVSLVALVLGAAGLLGCTGQAGSAPDGSTPTGGSGAGGAGGGSGGRGGSGAGGSNDGGSTIGDARPMDAAPLGTTVTVHLVPRAGVSGMTRVNFAVPLAPGQLSDAAAVRVLIAGAEVPSGRRALARHPDGSVRSVQIQIDVAVAGESDVTVAIGQAGVAGDLTLVPVADTLNPADGTAGPRVWALLPARWLSGSGVAGPQLPEADVTGAPLDAWARLCDYAEFDVANFVSQMSDTAVWLFDRGTTAYRGYARRGDLLTLETAYRETAIYRAGITGTGTSTRIPIAPDDAKYHYTQNMAIHYLLSGDDRFREAAEAVGRRTAVVWPSPGYAGGEDFWTERSAGFGLLAFVWAMIVSDDAAAEFRGLADAAVTAHLEDQEMYPAGYTDTQARCFAHSAEAHSEGFGYWGCSPWMSAILADGLDAYATERGGAQAQAARASIVKLARAIARDGLDSTGKPYYWMGVGDGRGEIDDYDEHWGEPAYVVALGWHHAGRNDTALEMTARALAAGLRANGGAPHMRSFNWQCRSAVATPYYQQ